MLVSRLTLGVVPVLVAEAEVELLDAAAVVAAEAVVGVGAEVGWSRSWLFGVWRYFSKIHWWASRL